MKRIPLWKVPAGYFKTCPHCKTTSIIIQTHRGDCPVISGKRKARTRK